MNIIAVFESFQTQDQALEYLEKVRWRGEPTCPYCKSKHVGRHTSPDRKKPRWQCYDCSRTFSVTVGTIFHGTHVPLRNWFLVLALMLNAKKSASAYQIARDLGMRRPTVWSMMHRVRTAMVKDQEQADLLHGIVEADEVYIGGAPRKGNNGNGGGDGDSKPKRGRGTSKTPVVGVVERNGRVAAQVAEKRDLKSKGLAKFLTRFVDPAGTILVTDEFPAYRSMSRIMQHVAINHQECYADGPVHVNSIEGFWSLVKRAWHGSHHHYSKKYMPLYIAESCYKYNKRKVDCSFENTMAIMVGV